MTPGSGRLGAGTEALSAPPSWLAQIEPSGRVRVRPEPTVPLLVAGSAGLVWAGAALYGLTELYPLWSLAALVAGAGALALAARGYPVVGAAPLLLGVGAWGMAAGGKAPESVTNVPGGLGLLGWNLAYTAPLLVAYLAAIWVDARRLSYLRVRGAIAGRRWWGAGVAEGTEPERLLGLLEAIPSARFVVARDGSCLVVAGARAAVVRAVEWPAGRYTDNSTGEVLRTGQPFPTGTDDLAAVGSDVRVWSERLAGAGVECRGFVVVRPLPDRPDDEVLFNIRARGEVAVLTAHEFVEVVGGFLAPEGHRIDVNVMNRLDSHLGLFKE